MGDLIAWPVTAASAGAAAGAAAAAAGAGAAWPAAGAASVCTYWTGAATPPLTMRTLPSVSVISSSEILDSDTRSISVLSLRRSMGLQRRLCRSFEFNSPEDPVISAFQRQLPDL